MGVRSTRTHKVRRCIAAAVDRALQVRQCLGFAAESDRPHVGIRPQRHMVEGRAGCHGGGHEGHKGSSRQRQTHGQRSVLLGLVRTLSGAWFGVGCDASRSLEVAADPAQMFAPMSVPMQQELVGARVQLRDQ